MSDVHVDKTGWTPFKPVVCECVSAKLVYSKTKGGSIPSVLLKLIEVDTGIEILRFLNLKQTKANNFVANPNSNFAKLYRLTTGENPKQRFYRSQHLAAHFEGYLFHVEYERAVDATGKNYLKATKVEPTDPIITDEWFPTGALRPKKRKKALQPTCSDVAKVTQKACRKVAVATQAEGAEQLGLTPELNPIQHTTSKVKPLSHVDMHYPSNTERVIVYEQQNNEAEEVYLDRIIDETL